MQEHQLRVINEKEELDSKLGKLRSFFESEHFGNVPNDEKNRLKNQAYYMRQYSEVLGQRIEAFKNQEK